MLSYLLTLVLDSDERASDVKMFLKINETNVVLRHEKRLKEHQGYIYSVTAINFIGNTTTGFNLGQKFRKIQEKLFMNLIAWFIINYILNAGVSDLQDVTTMVVGESTVDIQCLFISGSDAVGCKVVVVSDHQNINNETANLTRNNTSAYGQLILTHKSSCYHRVVAYTITIDHHIVSTFYLEEALKNSETNTACPGKY